MKALPLLKHNIDTLLARRGETRRQLAEWVRQSTDKKKTDPWISRIFTREEREFQIKYLDRIASYFGIEVYQLFMPNISSLTERRSGRDRRSGVDRRIGHQPSMRAPLTMQTLSPLMTEVVRIAEDLQGKDLQRWVHWGNAQIALRGPGPARALPPGQTRKERPPRAKGDRHRTKDGEPEE